MLRNSINLITNMRRILRLGCPASVILILAAFAAIARRSRHGGRRPGSPAESGFHPDRQPGRVDARAATATRTFARRTSTGSRRKECGSRGR